MTLLGNTTFLKSGQACSCMQLVVNIFGQIRLLLALQERLQTDAEESRAELIPPLALPPLCKSKRPELYFAFIALQHHYLRIFLAFKEDKPAPVGKTSHKYTKLPASHRSLLKTWGTRPRRAPLLTSAWCSSFCCRTSITNSARRIVSSNFLAGVTNRPTFSVVQELELKGRQNEKLDVQ